MNIKIFKICMLFLLVAFELVLTETSNTEEQNNENEFILSGCDKGKLNLNKKNLKNKFII